ncbi:hypothetical protein Tcan_08656 [Toxocara canis]|uniref:Uncharacterized protein n=1 Tax=Toxocara canis TaxID=6265 RepID=A0A0B2W0K3_TOXCA|nr:hypothetical protein Tcan_08656 [Toxocara canis]
MLTTTPQPIVKQFCVRILRVPSTTQRMKIQHGKCRRALPYEIWRSYFMLAILLAGCRTAVGDYPRVVIMLEKYSDTSLWEFHSRSSRQAEVSRKTWNEYILYKQQTCRTDAADSSKAASDYFNWEEMTFHKNLRLKLLPSSLSGEPLALPDAMMLSKIDGRLLAPEAESLCQMGVQDDSEQNEVAEKDKFEDTLISR